MRIPLNLSEEVFGGRQSSSLLEDRGWPLSLPLKPLLASEVFKYFPGTGCHTGTPLRATRCQAISHFYLLFMDHLSTPIQPNRSTRSPAHIPSHLAFSPPERKGILEGITQMIPRSLFTSLSCLPFPTLSPPLLL